MIEKELILKVKMRLTILNEANFNDFDTEEKSKFLVQEMLDQSVWPGEGIDCEVVSVTTETN